MKTLLLILAISLQAQVDSLCNLTTEVVHAVDVVIRGEKYYGKDVSRLIGEIQTSMLSGKSPR